MKLYCSNSDGVVFEVLPIAQYHSIWQIADRGFQCLFRSSLHYSLCKMYKVIILAVPNDNYLYIHLFPSTCSSCLDAVIASRACTGTKNSTDFDGKWRCSHGPCSSTTMATSVGRPRNYSSGMYFWSRTYMTPSTSPSAYLSQIGVSHDRACVEVAILRVL